MHKKILGDETSLQISDHCLLRTISRWGGGGSIYHCVNEKNSARSVNLFTCKSHPALDLDGMPSVEFSTTIGWQCLWRHSGFCGRLTLTLRRVFSCGLRLVYVLQVSKAKPDAGKPYLRWSATFPRSEPSWTRDKQARLHHTTEVRGPNIYMNEYVYECLQQSTTV